MHGQNFQSPRTANLSSSIWLEPTENAFRQHVVELEKCTNAVPIDPQVFLIRQPDEAAVEGNCVLPLTVEQQLANDFAAIVAVEEGAQSVSAVCIEQHVNHTGITVCFAAVDSINIAVQLALKEIANILMRVTTFSEPGQIDVSYEQLCTLIVKQHHRRILGRLRSIKWQKPIYLSRSHKKPLWQDFDNLIHRASFLYNKKESQAKRQITTSIQHLARTYQTFETTPSNTDEEDIANLQALIRASYTFCTTPSAREYTLRLTSHAKPTSQISSALKTLHQIEKLAAYQRIPQALIQTSRQYPSILSKINLAYLTPYTSIPVSIAYEPWAKTSHVHAEVQLAVYYDVVSKSRLGAKPLPPRAIGTSKHLCYLCYLFLTRHRTYPVANTHGRLYDQWTIPDLAEIASDDRLREKYTCIIKGMDEDVVEMTRRVNEELQRERDSGGRRGKKAEGLWRVEPMTSREDLLLTRLDQEEEENVNGRMEIDSVT